MPSFPPPGAVTICEINRDLGKRPASPLPLLLSSISARSLVWFDPPLLWPLAVAADALSDARAKDAYGDVLVSPLPSTPRTYYSSSVNLPAWWGARIWGLVVLAVVLQGMVFAPIPFQPEALLPSREPAAPAADQVEPAETAPAPGLAATISEFFRRMVFPPLDVSLIVLSESLILSVNFFSK